LLPVSLFPEANPLFYQLALQHVWKIKNSFNNNTLKMPRKPITEDIEHLQEKVL